MDSKFTFEVNCNCDSDCDGECECKDFECVYEVTGCACSGESLNEYEQPFVFWDDVTVDEDDRDYAYAMEDAIAQIAADIDNGNTRNHFCRIGDVIYVADWEFEEAQDDAPSRLTVFLREVDQTRVAAYI